jgi:hypothetical protein
MEKLDRGEGGHIIEFTGFRIMAERRTTMKRPGLAASCVMLVVCALAVWALFQAIPLLAAERAKERSFSPYVDSKGDITRPTDFRLNWVHLGSWVVPDEKAPGYGFHDVYTQKSTVEAYRKTGKFPDGAVLVKEIRTVKSAKMATGPVVYHARENAVWFVMVRDTKGRFPGNRKWGDGWGWALFKADNPSRDVATDFKKDCLGCHVPARNTEWVYVEGYPTLRR